MATNNPTNLYFTGDGATTNFSFTFPYLSPAHVKATVDGEAVSVTRVSPSVAQISPAPANGTTVRVYRETPETPIVNWADGAVILGRHLNAAQTQALYIAQEAMGVSENLSEEAKEYALSGIQDAVNNAVSSAAGLLEAAIEDDLLAAENAKLAAESARDAAEGYKEAAEAAAGDVDGVVQEVEEAALDAIDAVDNFKRYYLGSYSMAPTLDHNGDPIIEGAIYFNTTDDRLQVWDGSVWQDAYFAVDLPEEVLASIVVNDSGVSGTYVKDALNTLNSGKADSTHAHSTSDIAGLSDALAGKADAEHGHTIEDIDGLETALNGKAADDHGHEIADIDGLETALNGKASTSSVSSKADASRKVEGGGLASGGGDLSADRTITVSKASASEFRTGTEDGKGLTPKTPWDAAAAVSLTDAGTITVNMANFINAEVTLGGNRTLGNPSNAKPGQSGTIYIVQDGTGGRTLAFSGNWKFAGGSAPSLTTSSGAVDALHYKVRASNFIEATLAKDVK